MALTIDCNCDEALTVEDYMQRVDRCVDARDFESMVESAPLLRRLANNRKLAIEVFNGALHDYLSGKRVSPYTAQSFTLARSRSLYVRGNVWAPASASAAMRDLEERVFTHDVAHDHNFAFLTVGYWGPGYETETYEYDRSSVLGVAGEQVELRLIERTTLPFGKVMAYRPCVDVHVQHPPPDLSITLNLIADDESRRLDQYFFDIEKQRIVGVPSFAASAARAALIEMACLMADEETKELLAGIASQPDGCRRARIAALAAMTRLAPDAGRRLLSEAAEAHDQLTRSAARAFMQDIDSAARIEPGTMASYGVGAIVAQVVRR